MRRTEFVEIFARLRDAEVVITGPGGVSGALCHAADLPATIYNMEMGYAAAVCLGVALATPGRRIVAMEGEGSIIAGMSVLSTIGRYRPPNLIVIAFDNGIYGTGSGMVESATRHGTDLAAVARACGIKQVAVVQDPHTAHDVLNRAFSENGPWFLLARIEPTDITSGQRPTPGVDQIETAYAFRRALTQEG